MLHTIASFLGLTRPKPLLVQPPAKHTRVSMELDSVRLFTRSGKHYMDFDPIVTSRRGACKAASRYMVNINGNGLCRARIAGCYRTRGGVMEKIGIPVLWAHRGLYGDGMDHNTHISKIIRGVPGNDGTVTLVRMSFSIEGDDYAVDFHVTDLSQQE